MPFICEDQINWDYFTVDDNGKIIPKVYPTFTQVPENVVPTTYDSLALATAAATASPVTIIAEVVNAGNPSENGVYAIEPNGDTKKLDSGLTNKYSATGGGSASLTHTQTLNFKVNTDKTITEAQISGSDALIPYSPLRVDALNNVFTKAGDIYPVLSTATTESMAIDTATGQIGLGIKDTYSKSGIISGIPYDFTNEVISDIFWSNFTMPVVNIPFTATAGKKRKLDVYVGGQGTRIATSAGEYYKFSIDRINIDGSFGLYHLARSGVSYDEFGGVLNSLNTFGGKNTSYIISGGIHTVDIIIAIESNMTPPKSGTYNISYEYTLSLINDISI